METSEENQSPWNESASQVNPHGLNRFEGKTAVVTGSTRGIGKGIARRFASEGAAVVVTGRSAEAGETVANEIRESGSEATFVAADMADPESIKRVIDTAAEQYGTIDVLVNNAAAWTNGPFEEQTLEDWETVMNVSLRAPWLTSKYALEYIPHGGSILNISSVHSTATDPGRFPYNVSKAGLNGLTRALAIELGSLDITVNALVVGNIVKPYSDADPSDTENWSARLLPVNRRGTPEDVAGLVTYLGTADARFITGASIPVDGGRLACLVSEDWPGNT